MEWVDLFIGTGFGAAAVFFYRWWRKQLFWYRIPKLSKGQTYCAVITSEGVEMISFGVLAPFRRELFCKLRSGAKTQSRCAFVRIDKRGRFLYEVVS